MPKTIWKYAAGIQDVLYIAMPENAQILHVGMQGHQPHIWALVDPDRPQHYREIRWYGTGGVMPENPGRYLGTVMLHGGALVFHAFERP